MFLKGVDLFLVTNYMCFWSKDLLFLRSLLATVATVRAVYHGARGIPRLPLTGRQEAP